MFSALTPHPRVATKRNVIYWRCASVFFLAAALFITHGRLQAPVYIPSKHAASGVSTQIQPRLVASYGKLPLSFEVNQGQTDPGVKFLSRGRGYTLFLAANEAVLELRKPSTVSSQLPAIQIFGPESWNPMEGSGRLLALPGQSQRPTDNGPRTKSPIGNRKSEIENRVVRLRLVGANHSAAVMGHDELPGKANYFIGNDPKKWRTNVPTYAKVRYHNVYPGVDLEYYGNQGGELEYDFVVAPGADPSAIALDVGARLVPARLAAQSLRAAGLGRPQGSPLRIASDGDLVIAAEGGEVRFHKPLVYQEQESGVKSQKSGAKDPTGELQIDHRQSTIPGGPFHS